jgi:hypothetical protein
MHPTLWDFTRSPCAQPQACPTLQISFLIALHRRIIWIYSQLSVRRRPSLHSKYVSDKNHTPLSGDLSQVCVLENVSRSCNHQQPCPQCFSHSKPFIFLFLYFILFASPLKKVSFLSLPFLFIQDIFKSVFADECIYSH